MKLLFVFNTLCLIVSCLWIAQRATKKTSRVETLSYAFLLAWGNIIITANILSLISKLHDAALFCFTSILIQCLCVLLVKKLYRLNENHRNVFTLLIRPIYLAKKNKILLVLFAAFVIMLFICLSYVPFIPDTLALKLPKIHFYLQSGQLLPTKDVNFEIMWMHPVNAAIAWLYFIIYRLDLNSILLFSLLNWVFLGFSVYAISRKLEASHNASLFSTALLLLSETVIMAGTADSDDIVAATPFAIGLLALLRWIRSQESVFAILTGLGFGLSFGNKPFMVFFYPAVIVLAIGFPLRFGLSNTVRWVVKQWRSIVLAAVAALIMIFGVLTENATVRKNPLVFPNLFASHRNQALDTKTFGINMISQNFTLFVTPFVGWYADVTRSRPETTKWINQKASNLIEHIFNADQKQVDEIYSAHHNKTAVMDELYYDHSAQFGFLPHIILLSIFLLFLRRKQMDIFAAGLASAFVIWDLTYCFHYKYIAGIMRYWIIVFIPAAPAVARSWDWICMNKGKLLINSMLSIFMLAFGLTCISAIRAITKNHYRSLQAILDGRNRNDYSDLFSTEIQKLLRDTPAFHVFSYYTNPLFLFIQLNQDAQITYGPSLSQGAPNIVTSMEFTPLMKEHPYIAFRFLPVEVNSDDRTLFLNKGKCPNGVCYVNNITKVRSEEKRFLLFQVFQPAGGQNFPVTSIAPWNLNFPTENLRMQISERDHKGDKIVLVKWSSIRGRNVRLSRARKSLIIELQKVKSKQKFFAEYAYHR